MINEMTLLRANIMGGMNEYIKELGDDDIWDIWIDFFPDECSEDELMEMAKDKELCDLIFYHFSLCYKTAHRLFKVK